MWGRAGKYQACTSVAFRLPFGKRLTAEPVGLCTDMNIPPTQPTFEQAFSFDNLLSAYHRARRGKQAREEVTAFGWNVERNVLALREELFSGAYSHGHYRKFIISDSKRREIQAAPFRDRVVHQAMVAALDPIFERHFIYDSYACRRGKGTQAALARFERFAHVSRYALMMDVSKYFASIDQQILLELLVQSVRDERLLHLCEIVIKSCEESPGVGIPIGNLTSQLFANVYLNELDQYVKHGLRERRYVRYMDDFVILHDDKAYLHALRGNLTEFLAGRLHLTVHPRKAQIMPTAPGVPFLGLRIFPHHKLLRASTVRRFVRRARMASRAGGGGLSEEAVRSWKAWARGANSRGLLRSLAGRLDEPRLAEFV